MEGLAADLDGHAEVRADVEGWIDVDELEAAGVFDLAAKCAGLQGGKNELVVALDQLVGPTLHLPPARVETEFLVVALLFPWFVNVLKALEREDCGADFARFPVLGEFHLTFVGEEEEAVLLWEWFALLDEFDEIALLCVGKIVGGVARHKSDHWLGAIGDFEDGIQDDSYL